MFDNFLAALLAAKFNQTKSPLLQINVIGESGWVAENVQPNQYCLTPTKPRQPPSQWC